MTEDILHSKLFFQLGKVWQGQDPVITWQLTPSHLTKGLYGMKLYLQIDCRQNKKALVLLKAKNIETVPNAAISTILRKQVPGGRIASVYRNSITRDIWIPFFRSQDLEPFASLFLADCRPPELSLIHRDQRSFFRFGQKGTYTKIKSSSNVPTSLAQIDSEWDDTLPQLFKDFLNSLSPELEQHEDGKVDSIGAGEAGSVETPYQVSIRRKIQRRKKTLSSSLAKMISKQPTKHEISILHEGVKELQLKYFGGMSQADHLESKGEASREIKNGENLKGELDPRLSVGKNIDGYFKKIKKAQRAAEIGIVFIEKCRSELEDLLVDLNRLQDCILDLEALRNMERKHKLKPETKALLGRKEIKSSVSNERRCFLRFFSKSGGEFWVGKGASDNDQLTKQAKAKDYWFHVSHAGGAHIIVPRRLLPMRNLSECDKREAGILAIHFSKRRSKKEGEIQQALRSQLKKRKDSQVGLWELVSSQAFSLSYSQVELEEILSRKKS